MALKVGQQFVAYETFERVLRQYENEVFANYSVSSSTRLVLSDKITNSEVQTLKYKRIHFDCKLSGEHVNRSEIVVRSASTYKKGCGSKIKLVLKKIRNGHALEVTTLNEEHNHIRNATLYRSMPKQRRDVIKNASELLRALQKRNWIISYSSKNYLLEVLIKE